MTEESVEQHGDEAVLYCGKRQIDRARTSELISLQEISAGDELFGWESECIVVRFTDRFWVATEAEGLPE